MVENFNGEPKLPDGWSLRALPEELYFISGKAHEKHISDVGHYVVVNSKFISSDGRVRKYSTNNFQPARRGDILMVMSDLPNGKALAKTFLVDKDKLYAVNQRVCILRARTGFPEYFRYQLDRAKYFLSFDDGVQQTHLLNKVFEECPVIVPKSVEEQKAIATALKDIDGLIALLDALIAKKRDIKQAAMQQLLTGKTRLPGFKGAWQQVALREIAEIDLESLPSSTGPEWKLRYISLEDVELGTLKGHTELKFRDAPSRARRRIVRGDILFGTVRPNLQSHCIFDQAGANWIASTGFSVIRCRSHAAVTSFVFHQIMTSGLTEQIERIIAGSNYPAVSSRDVAALTIPIPALDEQNAISEVLDAMEHEIVVLNKRMSKAECVREGMMQQLLTGRIRLV